MRGAIKKDNQVSMRKATFLILDGINICNSLSKKTLLHNVVQQTLKFEMKHTGNKIGTVACILARKQGVLHLSPPQISREYQICARALEHSEGCVA
jgi:hypothetical protein